MIVEQILAQTGHRPWPAPPGRGVGRMTWHDLLFAHWPVEPEKLRPWIPKSLELDLFDGVAWLGVVPFRMTGVRPHWFPDFPPVTSFLELNVRTYVTVHDRPGVWFFSLDAASRLAVRAARWRFFLPYFDARMSLTYDGPSRIYASSRTHRQAPAARFEARYHPAGEPYLAAPGSLDHWLTERYCLYSADGRGNVFRGEIQHAPWPLQPAAMESAVNAMTDAIGLSLDDPPAHLHFVERIDVVAWPLMKVNGCEPRAVRST